MTDLRITNCHIHTFTSKHIPRCYPHPFLVPVKRAAFLIRFLAFLARFFSPHWAETLDRLYRFQKESDQERQDNIFRNVRCQYPGSTRFVVLPVDMGPIGHGAVAEDIVKQHDELAELAQKMRHHVIPFANAHPGTEGGVEEAKKRIAEEGFKGLKLYPKMGFSPSDTRLFPLFEELEARGLPVMTHCSRGGVRARKLGQAEADVVSAPDAFDPVWVKYPRLKVCFAHFGGTDDWRDYVDNGYDPDNPDARVENWQIALRDRIAAEERGPVWTDISYTLFHFDDFVPFLKLFLTAETEAAERLRRRVLFGSDYYMTRQKKLSERSVCFRLRNALGEEVFRQIAEVNPEVWLGERAEI